MNSIFGYNHADSGKGLSPPTRSWCPYMPLLRFPALSFCRCNSNTWLHKTKSVQYDKWKFSWRLKFVIKSKFLLKDVALTVQEKSCVCLENKDITRATAHFLIVPFGHPLAMTWMASCVRKYMFPSVLVHLLFSMLRLSALVQVTEATHRHDCFSL